MAIRIIAFIFGSCWSSFLNTMVWRYGLTVKHPGPCRSHCDHCQQLLRIWQLIPIMGWLLQAGRCHNCHKRLSAWQPLCELVVGCISTCLVIKPWSDIFIIGLACSCLLVIASQDHYDLSFAWPLLLGLLPLAYLRLNWQSWICDCCIIVLILPLYHYRKFGNGDCDLLILMVIILGYQTAVLAIMIACLLACCHPALYRGQAIAFAPCLCLALAGSVVLPALRL